EHAMPDWIRRTALSDMLGTDFATLADDALYRNLDRLHPQRARIEQALAARERTLFNLDDTIYLYDLTSTYFEGQCPHNPQAKRGYSRDHRPDCKQVVVGLVLDREGFPKAHEVFDGNRQDRTTLDEMLEALEQRTGGRGGATVVIDRGMAFAENLAQIRARGHHYIVAGRPAERHEHLDAFEDATGWTEILRTPSPRNPEQKKTRVFVKRAARGDEAHLLCRSDGRREKDQAIRDKHEHRLLRDLTKHQPRVTGGQLRDPAYHLLVAIEKRFLDQGVHTSWATLREQLSTHHVVTVVLPSTHGQTLRIRRSSTPEAIHREIYRTLQISPEVIKPVRTWTRA